MISDDLMFFVLFTMWIINQFIVNFDNKYTNFMLNI